MSTAPLRTPAPGESLVDIEPELLQQVDPGWRHRLSLYTGRALTDTALTAEQLYRSGRLALLSQLVTPGIASGLAASLDASGRVRVTAGYGFAATGEDVTLLRDLVMPAVDAVPVVDAVTGVTLQNFGDLKKDPKQKTRVFVLLLRPVTGKATITSGGCLEVTGELTSSATRDPEEYAFEDWQLVDGAELVLAIWPNTPPLTLPSATPAGTFRNRIASCVFNAEFGPDPADGSTAFVPPWSAIGVALGLAAFDNAWTLLFFDRNVVVRSGGRAPRAELVSAAPAVGGAFLSVPYAAAEARLLQVLEQNAQIASQTDLTPYLTLPASTILPVGAIDLQQKKNRWFPKQWSVRAAPIHAEEVETALRAMMFSAPFDLTGVESANVLVPLTDDLYDPDVLLTEVVAQVFYDEQTKAINARNAVLQHRKFLQQEASVLLTVTGQPVLDLDAGLSADELKARDAAVYTPPADGSEAFGTTLNAKSKQFTSNEVTRLTTLAGAAPYTNNKIPLFTANDLNLLGTTGLSSFTDAINARIHKVEDAINLSFLQTQTNIYRYRTNVLKATDASRLVTSPIIANIADRESATATAQDLTAYLDSIGATPSSTPSGTVSTSATTPTSSLKAKSLVLNLPKSPSLTLTKAAPSLTNLGGLTSITKIASLTPITAISELPSQMALPATDDVTGQLPMVGLQFNLRTLNIAERLKTSPSNEALQYSLAARTGFLDTVLAQDFGITVDDLEILVQEEDPKQPGTFKLTTYTIADVRKNASAIYASISRAGLSSDADESTVFSGGITTLEHHTLLLRAVEARIALYKQFLGEVAISLSSIQSSLSRAEAGIAQTDNQLADARGNLSLVNGLLADEQTRVDAVNARRTATLQNVPFIVLTRAATLQVEADVPSRQLVPANVESPVPAALQSTAIIPPELRELASLLREAPASWLPATADLLAKLEHPQQFIDIASQMRVRAAVRLQTAPAQSSATSHPGPYGDAIAAVFESQQGVVTSFVQQRSTYDPVPLATLSWASQKTAIFNVAAINDLVASDAVHLEIASDVATIVQNVSKVATALYLRVCATLPAARLQWAEYLRGDGQGVSLRTLNILPGWNAQDYVDRQQMQMLVDWLFTQIDTGLTAAVAFMSDMVRTSILVASHAPVTDIIAGEVAARIKPAVGGLVSLTSSSSRVAHGMPVLLYQKDGSLAARAIVDDLDTAHVSAKVTTVYQPNTFLDDTTHVQFLNDDPEGTLRINASRALR